MHLYHLVVGYCGANAEFLFIKQNSQDSQYKNEKHEHGHEHEHKQNTTC